VVYLFSVAVKLAHPWWQGTGRVIVFLATERAPSQDPGILQGFLGPILAMPGMARVAEVGVMGTEVLLPLGLAWGRSRRVALAVGVAMHTVMHGWLFPQLFTFLMLALYGAWTPSDDRSVAVGFDPARRTHTWLRALLPALDTAGRCREMPEPVEGGLAVSPRPGVVHRGPAAWASLACRLPVALVLWALAALALPATVGGVPRAVVDNAATLAVLTLAMWGRGRRA